MRVQLLVEQDRERPHVTDRNQDSRSATSAIARTPSSLPSSKQAGAIGGLLDLAEDVRAHQDRVRSPASERISPRISMIWRGSRPLVGSSSTTISGSCTSACAKRRALADSRATVPGSACDDLAERHETDDAVHRRLDRGRCDAAQSRHEAEEFVDPHMAVQRHGFRHVADLAPGGQAVAHDIVPGDGDPAGRRRNIAGQHAQERRLARTVRAEQAEHFAAADAEIEAVDRGQRTVALAHPFGDDRRRLAILAHHAWRRDCLAALAMTPSLQERRRDAISLLRRSCRLIQGAAISRRNRGRAWPP